MINSRIQSIVLLSSLLLAAGRLAAQAQDAAIEAKIDSLFAPWNKPDSPGAAVAVARDGVLLLTKGYGMANLEHDVPITPSTVFYVGSISKQFTAACVALLALEGKLSLDDDVRSYVPELPNYGRTITIRQLIYHTSGIRDFWSLLILGGRRYDDIYDIHDILDITRRQRALSFTPGEQRQYSNTGYALLSLVVERAADKPMRQFAEERIFQPLGMRNTIFNDDHTRILKNRAHGYAPKPGGGFQLNIVNNDLVGAGGIWTTVEDLSLWDENFSSGKVGGEPFVKLLQEPGSLNSGERLSYGFGLNLGAYKGLRTVGHSGALAGYRADMVRFPDQRFTVIVLTNLSSMAPGQLSRQIAELYLSDVLAAASRAAAPARAEKGRKKGAAPSAKQLQRYVGLYRNPEDESVRRIELKGGKLVFVRRPGNETELSYLANDRFRMLNVPGEVEVTFSPRTSELPLQMKITGGDEGPALFERFEPAKLTEDQLRLYEGTYFSEELQVRYVLTVRNDTLRLRIRHLPEISLDPVVTDRFRNDELGALRFVRSTSGTIEGISLDASGLRDLTFVRCE